MAGSEIETRNDPGNFYPGGTVVPVMPQNLRNYAALDDKPKISGVELVGDRTLAEIGAASAAELDDYATKTEVTSAVNAEKSRAIAAEELKADKTTVSALSTAVEDRRTKGDLAVYERTISATIAIEYSGEILDTIECRLTSRTETSETYQGVGPNGYSVEIVLAVSGVDVQGVSTLRASGDYLGGTYDAESPSYSDGIVSGTVCYDSFTVTGTVSALTADSDKSLATTEDARTVAQEVVRTEVPFDIVEVPAGASLRPSTISRFTPSSAADVGFVLTDPPAGKMAEYEMWVDCKTAVPASVVFTLANTAKVLDARVEGEAVAMEASKTYVYHIQAFENPDANHVTLVISQSTATSLADYSPEVLYAPNTAMEVDTTKLTNRTFTLKIVAIGETRSVTVQWGDGEAMTAANVLTSARTTFSHTYAQDGIYVVQVSDVDVNIQSSTTAGIVRALRWGDSITNGWATYQDCTNLVGPVPKWGVSMTTSQSAFQGCTKLTGAIPSWGAAMTKCSGTFQSCASLTGIWDENATAEEIMPSRMVEHQNVVAYAASAVTKYFTSDWGGTKTA